MPYGNHAEEQNLQMQVTRLLKSWKILSMKCVYKFLVSFGRMDVMYNSFAELENGKTSLL
jgi:hypothetical protein